MILKRSYFLFTVESSKELTSIFKPFQLIQLSEYIKIIVNLCNGSFFSVVFTAKPSQKNSVCTEKKIQHNPVD